MGMRLKNALKEKELIAKMQEMCYGNREDGHVSADYFLCAMLKHLGFEKLVDAWEKVPKWYA